KYNTPQQGGRKMTRRRILRLGRSVSLFLFIVTMVSAAVSLAQEPPKYTAEEYKAFQELKAETDAAKKTALVVQFLKNRPQSTLREHVIAAYQEMMNGLQSAQKWPELATAGEQVLEALPDDVYTVSMLATAYQETKNFPKFVVYGEKVFAKNPNGNLAYYL